METTVRENAMPLSTPNKNFWMKPFLAFIIFLVLSAIFVEVYWPPNQLECRW